MKVVMVDDSAAERKLCRLPDMTGLDFLARLNGPAEAIAVMLLTGATSEEHTAEAIKAGAQHYLVESRITSEGLSLAIQKATLKVERDRLAADFEPGKTLSLGLRIVQILTRQLKGTLEFDRGGGQERQGTSFRVSFPIHDGPGVDVAPA